MISTLWQVITLFICTIVFLLKYERQVTDVGDRPTAELRFETIREE